ncbi:hypothetical protein CUMW_115490 [Citrus unshiu]|nr:hypothetical protein CUMW_115490 [Citrus unshiu]
MLQGLRNLLSTREPESRPVCAVIDVMMGSAAVECAMWQARIQDVKPGEARLLPGLPVDMALFESDLKHRPHGPPPGGPPPLRGAPGSEKIGPPEAGDQPHWMKEVEGSMALMFNTCDGLEGPFINYLANQLGKPVWGVGLLLPEQFYKSGGSMLRDHEMRTNRRSSNMTEDEIVQWLNLKSCGSVLYVSFGTEVDPTLDEYLVLANVLEASNRPFIWVIQGGAEAIGCRVPILAWPIRGDQHYNAKFVINHLKVGYMISDDQSKSIQKDDIVSGIEKLMSDQEIKKRAHMLRSIFNHGFPLSSVVSLNAFIDEFVPIEAIKERKGKRAAAKGRKVGGVERLSQQIDRLVDTVETQGEFKKKIMVLMFLKVER